MRYDGDMQDAGKSLRAVGAQLRELRERLGLSTYDVSKVSGVSPSYISKVERGERPATESYLRAVAPALRRSPSALFTLAGLTIVRATPAATEDPISRVVMTLEAAGWADDVTGAIGTLLYATRPTSQSGEARADRLVSAGWAVAREHILQRLIQHYAAEAQAPGSGQPLGPLERAVDAEVEETADTATDMLDIALPGEDFGAWHDETWDAVYMAAFQLQAAFPETWAGRFRSALEWSRTQAASSGVATGDDAQQRFIALLTDRVDEVTDADVGADS